MSGVEVRHFAHSDYSSLTAIHDSLFPDHPLFRKRIEYEDSCYGRTRYRMKRFVAETGTGEVVGFGEYKHHFFSYHPRIFEIGIEVHPQWQRRGIGGRLYDRMMAELAAVGWDAVRPMVLSTSTSGVRFLQKRGFVQESGTVESRLDLDALDSEEFSETAERLDGEGVAIGSFADAAKLDPAAGRKLKDLEDSGAADVPHAITDNPMDFHDYEIVILNSPIMVWEGSSVARLGNLFVGSSSLMESGMDGVLDQGFTVVRPGYRGKGVAQAVKFRAATYARSVGAKHIRTFNDSENAPMLAVNRKLGFERRAEWITFEKSLRA